MFSHVLIQVAHTKLSLFPVKNNARISVTGSYAFCSSPPFLSTLPSLSLSLSRASILVVTSLNTLLV
ncbi:unnamed protein product [Hymenolepis diminuta]|uniref:Uncharacterized protein n=1 Tax=Hymenolepis diminuta TaxID=6216 RepID=A0A564YTM2_HYMDI|nr:unnamed protein product [Hymenolepis diminuta]VUZ48823.1 unnamed protein product [Hymenolepis diminuta]VUZ50621.1 unnamed protein product [Hymenolepis diminuta]